MPNLAKPSSVWTYTQSTLGDVQIYIICLLLKNIVLPIYYLYDSPFQNFKTI